MADIPFHLAGVRTRIEAACKAVGRDPASVHLLAVSKTRPAEDVAAAHAAGQTAFGENYVQEAEKPFCGIFSYAKHVSLEFGAGASLPDKLKVLEGEGKLRRHIKLSSAQDIAEKQRCRHVRECAKCHRRI